MLRLEPVMEKHLTRMTYLASDSLHTVVRLVSCAS